MRISNSQWVDIKAQQDRVSNITTKTLDTLSLLVVILSISAIMLCGATTIIRESTHKEDDAAACLEN